MFLKCQIKSARRRGAPGLKVRGWIPPVPSQYDRLYCGLGGCEAVCQSIAITNPDFKVEDGWESFGNSGFEYTDEDYTQCCRSVKVADGGARQVFTFDLQERCQ